ncbi:multiple sugar transport system permease protein [Actinoplanes campanulatus]|uniref:Multiple sugar transport system permease protein n=1 Tax=Actinoplanes campanulatus TaxID=113559 RepID=A0A7W5AFP5_9ACTN|nr:carbohydrate ABC transporter permease [Actinoplanes campanulatus]MBB3095196.1 multiple sugar transport system permease protein [Actinoplanes campanulatus]GGN24067.1 ABC transporter permease [Actinoplanes campanulatus]GID34800.1 ABC transporter permease [Actinoplanes campanulatus]
MTATPTVRAAARRSGRPPLKPTARQPRRRSAVLTVVTGVMLVYAILPLAWLFISATKTQEDLLGTFGLWFGGEFALFDNIADTFTYQDGIFGRWVLNTVIYVVVGAGGATLLAALAGYGLAKFDFRGRRAVFAVVLGGIAVPPTALAVPTFLLFAKMGLTDTPWAVIIPSLVSPFGLYLMWTYSTEAVPNEILESARCDGAGEFRIFFKLALPLLAPGLVTVLLFNLVAAWNNFFMPLIMLKNADLYPLTLGLYSWNRQANTVGGDVVFDLVITGSLLTIIPLTVAFLMLQRYWQSGLAAGSVKQ